MNSSAKFTATAALSVNPDTTIAIREIIEGVLDRLGGNPDIALVFFTHDHSANAEEICQEIQHGLGPETLIGGSGSGVIAGPVEIEYGPGIAVWAARIPGARAQAFQLNYSHQSGTSYAHHQ